MNKLVVGVVLLGAAAVTGCASQQQGRLYSMKDGRTSGVVLQNASGENGAISGSLPDGESCTGNFTTVAPDDASKLTDTSVIIGEAADTGVAMLSCGSNTVLKCTLARRPGEGFRYGACKDQQGTEYNMMF